MAKLKPLPAYLKRLYDTNKSKASHPKVCSYQKAGPIHLVIGPASMKMDIINTKKGLVYNSLREGVENASPKLKVALSGAFYSFGYSPQSYSLVRTLLGEVVKNGATTQSGDLGNYAYIIYMNNGEYKFGISRKVPYANVKRGMGGLIPIIINSQSGSKDKWYMHGNWKTGRCMIGYSKQNQMLLIIAQEYTHPVYDLDDFQNFYRYFGCENVVGLDGSTSAMLYYDGFWKFKNKFVKDKLNNTAVGFRL